MNFTCSKCKKGFKVENNLDVLRKEKEKHEKSCKGKTLKNLK